MVGKIEEPDCDGAAGWDNETLKEIGTKLTAKYPSLFGSFTGIVTDYKIVFC